MMIHSALRYPEHNERYFWHQALSQAVYFHNDTQQIMSWLYPTELWSHSKSYHSASINAYPWGCPVHVLQPRIQDVGKLPKLVSRSRQG